MGSSLEKYGKKFEQIGIICRYKTWSDINIYNEISEYNQFGTINGVIIVNKTVTPNNF